MTTSSPAPDVPGIAPENQPGEGSAAGWPLVLYFHHVHPDVEHYTAVSPALLDQALTLLLERFEPVDPHGVVVDAAGSGPQVLVTFDDGYRDNLTHAAPILDAHGVRAVFFVVVDWVGRVDGTNPRGDFLDVAGHEQLLDAGHRIAAHSMSHRRLSTLDPADARHEVRASLDWAHRPSSTPELFAFPYGDVPAHDVLDGVAGRPHGVLGFGTVRCPALPWSVAPHAVRRTYLPAHAPDLWPGLIRGWEQQWTG